MKVTEKFDVYNFGVVALEIIMEKHPTELLTSLSSSSYQNMMLHEILDQRLPPPNHLVAQAIFVSSTITLICMPTQRTKVSAYNEMHVLRISFSKEANSLIRASKEPRNINGLIKERYSIIKYLFLG
jgi:hypothetical protein